MKYQNLMSILGEVTEDIRDDITIVRLQWWANHLYITYWQGNLLIQQVIECKTPQKVNYWEININLRKLLYGFYIDRAFNDLLIELRYEPEIDAIIVSAETKSGENHCETIYEEENYEIDFDLPHLDFLEQPSAGQAILSLKEWRKIESAVCIARQVEYSDIQLEAIGDTIYLNAHGCSVAAYYCLNTKAEASLRESTPLPFEAIDYINTECPKINYVRLEFYPDWVMIQAGGNVRVFLRKCFFKVRENRRVEQPDTNVRVRVKRLEVIAALKEVSIDIEPMTPNSQRASLFLTSPRSLLVGGCTMTTRLEVEATGENQSQEARIIVWAKELVEILESIPDPNLNILLPTHPFEPMVIHSVGILIFYAGFYEECRMVIEPRDNIKEFYERQQSDGSYLQVYGLEQSPLEIYESLDMKRIRDEEFHDKRRSITRDGILHKWAVLEYNKVYCMAEEVLYLAQELLESMKTKRPSVPIFVPELINGIDLLQTMMETPLLYDGEYDPDDEDDFGQDRTQTGESYVVMEVLDSMHRLRMQTGRLWSVLTHSPRLYRLTVLIDLPSDPTVEPKRIMSKNEMYAAAQTLRKLNKEVVQTRQKLTV